MSHSSKLPSLAVDADDRACGDVLASARGPRVTVVTLRTTKHPSRTARRLLWLDACAGASAGVTLLALRSCLAPWFGVAVELVVFNAVANLAYASYSGTLATLAALGVTPPRRALTLLVAANAAWSCVCASLIARVWGTATVWGTGYLAFEALFVGALALAEYRVFRARDGIFTSRP